MNIEKMKRYVGSTVTVRIATANGEEHLIEDELVGVEADRLYMDNIYFSFRSPHYKIQYVHLGGLGVFDLFLCVIPENLTSKGRRIVEKYGT